MEGQNARGNNEERRIDAYFEEFIKNICRYAKAYYSDNFDSWIIGKELQEEMEKTYTEEVLALIYQEIGDLKKDKIKE